MRTKPVVFITHDKTQSTDSIAKWIKNRFDEKKKYQQKHTEQIDTRRYSINY